MGYYVIFMHTLIVSTCTSLSITHIPLDSNSTPVPLFLPLCPLASPPPPLLQVIAVNQDSLISQGRNVTTSANVAAHGQVWAKRLADGSVAVLLFNSVPSTTISSNNNDGPNGSGDAAGGGNVNVTVTATWEQLGFKADTVFHARSLWDQADVPGTLQGAISASLPYHDSAVFKLTPASATSGTVKVKGGTAAEAAKIASLSLHEYNNL